MANKLQKGERSMDKEIKKYWETFLKETGINENTKYYESFYFGADEKMATSLLDLVLQGNKTATSSALQEYINSDSPQPQVNDYSIVTDWNGIPKCIIQTTNVLKIKFKDVTYEICKREGEDETLKSWQDGHLKFFNEISKECGFEFSWDMYILFEDFKVIYQ